MEKLAKLTKVMGCIDYAVSTGCIAYGVYAGSWLYGIAGILGLVLAYLKPAEYMKDAILKKFMRKPVTANSVAPFEQFIPAGAITRSYIPRSRYQGLAYFQGKGLSRTEAQNPRDMTASIASQCQGSKVGVRSAGLNKKTFS